MSCLDYAYYEALMILICLIASIIFLLFITKLMNIVFQAGLRFVQYIFKTVNITNI